MQRREKLIVRSHDVGPTGMRAIFAKHALELGLQKAPICKAVFVVQGAPESLL
jgi:hypothetical protein